MKKLICLLTLALGGCFSLGEGKNASPLVNYVLEDAAISVPRTPITDPRTLLVPDTLGTAFYDGDNLVYSAAPGTRAHYRYARWTERPSKRFADLLRARLDAKSGFAAVSSASGQVHGNLLLDTDLTEFYHDARTSPGNVHMVLRADLVDLKSRVLISRKQFVQRIALSSYDAQGAAQAFNRASSQVLDELVAWLAEAKNTTAPTTIK